LAISDLVISQLRKESYIKFASGMDNKSCKVLMEATTPFTVRLSNLIDNLNTLKKKDIYLQLLTNMEKFDKIPSRFNNLNTGLLLKEFDLQTLTTKVSIRRGPSLFALFLPILLPQINNNGKIY
jgi:hypothetical protein